MINERELISRVEAADPRRLAEIMARPSPEEERVLRTYLGDARFERMRELVLQSSLTRSDRTTQGNVVVLHGIMGGELTYYETDAHPDPIWLKFFRLILGQFERLRVDDEGNSIIIKTFVGSYQMLPSPLVQGMEDMQRLYEESTYEPLAPLPSRFALACEFHNGLSTVIDTDRMRYIAGYNPAT